MCLIKEETTTYADGYSEMKKTVFACSHSVDGRTCDNTETEKSTRHVPGNSSQLVLRRPSSSRRDQVVLHQDSTRHRPAPRQERRYANEIGVRIRNWRPQFSIHRLDDRGSRHRRRRSDGESRTSGELMPEAPMPPPPPVVHQSGRRSPPPSALPAIITPPNRPTPPSGSGAAVVAYTTRDTIPSSSGTPSRTSSTRSKQAHQAAQDLLPLTVPASGPSVTSSKHTRPTPGLSRLRVESRPMFHDSTYGGSSNISPIDAPKIDTFSETHSNPTSERTASERYNYTNQTVVIGREDHVTDDEDKKSNSSEDRKSYRMVRRVRINDDPEMTQRKMQEDIRAAEEYQSQTSEQVERSVKSGSESRRRRHHGR
ncbi:hypothetical protein KCU85_g6756, partial [Aureobasidium melanogenum]